MLALVPAMMPIVPVGAIAVRVALRTGRPPRHAGKTPRSAAKVRRSGRGLGDGVHHALGEALGLGRVIGDAEADESLGEAHHAEPDLARAARGLRHRLERIAADLDHVVEEAHRVARHGVEPRPVEDRLAARVENEAREIQRAQVARFVGEQRHLAAGIGRFQRAELRGGVRAPDRVAEDEPRVTALPCRFGDRVE
jgi:hypothetical protein